ASCAPTDSVCYLASWLSAPCAAFVTTTSAGQSPQDSCCGSAFATGATRAPSNPRPPSIPAILWPTRTRNCSSPCCFSSVSLLSHALAVEHALLRRGALPLATSEIGRAHV